jgi:hypothetical protein
MKLSKFGCEKWGSYLADAAAESNWTAVRWEVPHVMTHTVYLEDVMDKILPVGEWHWRDGRGWLVLNDFGNKVRRARVGEYKQACDDKRTADGRPPCWKQSATEIAAYCDPTKQDKSFRARFANTNVIFDTIPDGRKQALGKKTRQEKEAVEKCPLCAQKVSHGTGFFYATNQNFNSSGKRHTNFSWMRLPR